VREALNLICGADGEGAREDQLAILRENRLARNAGLLHYVDVAKNRLRFGPRIAPLEAARRVLKGRSASYQADGYTHVKDTCYTWSELDALLARTGWELTGWPRKSGMPDDPAQLFRGRALELVRRQPMLQQAAIYERLVMPGNLFFLARPRP